MKKIKQFVNRIINMEKKNKLRVASVSVITLMTVSIIGGFILGAGSTGEKPQTVSSKEYIDYIVQWINDTSNDKDTFNILEIVPYKGMGEFYYYVGDERVDEGIKTTMKTDHQKYYIEGAGGYGKSYVFCKINNPFSNFTYEVMYREDENDYIIRNQQVFLSKVLPEYAYELDEKINLNVCEANDLTPETVNQADMIIVTTGTHDQNTLDSYNYWSGETGVNCYDAYGNEVAKNAITYGTYEKLQDGTLISRDANWESVQELMDVCLQGRDIIIEGETYNLKTPVVMDNQSYMSMEKDGNLYKFITLERMLNDELYGQIKEYITTDGTLNSYGIETGILNFDDSRRVEWAKEDMYDFFGEGEYSSIYEMSDPNAYSHVLTDNYWIYDGSSVLIPSNSDEVYRGASADRGFTEERVGKNPTVCGVMRFLLGLDMGNSGEKVQNPPVKVLEIQPFNQFKYNNYENVKALGKKMGFDVTKWTSRNYSQYIDVTSVSTNAFNSMNEDIIALYDVIYIGMEYKNAVTVDSNDKTIYNDKNLDGYVYLAFGDLIKVDNHLLGALETDYAKLNIASNLRGLVLAENDGERDENNALRLNRLFAAGTSKWNAYLNSKLEGGAYYILKDTSEAFGKKTDMNEILNEQLGNVRLSGNDITLKKYNELVKFKDAGKVFLMEDDIYYNNSRLIYGTSNFYKFVSETGLGKYKKAYTHDTSYKIPGALETGLPEIIMTEAPVEIVYDSNGLVSNSNPDQNSEEKGYQLRYVFDIKGEANTSYNVKLILDKNGDGIYNDEKTVDDDNELYYEDNIVLDASGTKNGIEVEVTLPVEMTGPAAWQIQVTKIVSGENTVLRALETGYTAVYGASKSVRVLQVIHAVDSSKIPSKEKFTLNMEANEQFRSLLKKAADSINFNIDVDCINAKEFEELYYYNGKETGYSISNDYNMLVIGFADAFGNDDISNDHGALDDIKDFIASGKVVLFTHDTTSFIQTPNYFVGKTAPEKVYAKTLAQYNSGTYKSEESYNTEKGYGYYDTTLVTKLLTYGSSYYSGELIKTELTGYTGNSLVRNIAYMSDVSGETYRKFAQTDKNLKDRNGRSLKSPTDGTIYYDENGDKVLAVDVSNIYKYNENAKNTLINHMGATIHTYTMGNQWNSYQAYYVYVYPYDYTGAVVTYTYRYRYEDTAELLNANRISKDKGYDWSYNINLAFRNILGMDKYGITLEESNRTGKSRPYYLSSLKAPSYATTGEDGICYVQELQGYTDMMAIWYAYSKNRTTERTDGLYTLMPYKKTYYTYPFTTTKVVKLNEGQVTQYPYNIPDQITVATTHAQNYALDMEDKDIVVWYSLGVNGNSTFYGSTYKDGGQNYYIYSKGNITYSGAGHSTIAGEEEMKLFVNTIIRTITSGNSIPTVVIDNGNRANDGSYIVYRNEYHDKYEILFMPKDSDLLTGYGVFKSGKITYVNTRTGEEKVLKEYGYGELVAGVEYTLEITDQKIIDAIASKEAEFIFEVTDNYNATGRTKAVFSTKKLFELD